MEESLYLELENYISARLIQRVISRKARIDALADEEMLLSPSEATPMGRFCKRTSEKSIEDYLKEMDQPFARTLFSYIDKAGIDDVECYKRALVDKKTFSKIKCNKDYKPSKKTIVAFALALRLDLKESTHLLKTAGYALSRSNKFDIIIEYFIKTQNYKTIDDVNEALYYFDQQTIN